MRRTAYYATLQKRRRSSLAGAASGEYAQLLLATRGNMDAALRDRAARDRERRLRALTKRVLLGAVGRVFDALTRYCARVRGAKRLFAKMCASTERLAYEAWRTYAANEKKVRRMLALVFAHRERLSYDAWLALVDRNRRARHYVREWRRLGLAQAARRDEIGTFLLSNGLGKRFRAWRAWAIRRAASDRRLSGYPESSSRCSTAVNSTSFSAIPWDRPI